MSRKTLSFLSLIMFILIQECIAALVQLSLLFFLLGSLLKSQGNDSNNWMGGMGQQAMGMGQSVPPFMMGGQSFQNPSPYGMPPNASSSMPPSSQMNSMPFAGGSYGGFSSWPSGQPSGTDQNWMNSQSGSQPSAMKPPVPGMDASSASTPAVGDITSQSLPELGDVGIAAEDKTRNGNSRELVNGDAAANAAPQQQQQPQQQSRHAQQQQPGSNVFNTMMSSSSVGASPSADASGSKVGFVLPSHTLPFLVPTLILSCCHHSAIHCADITCV